MGKLDSLQNSSENLKHKGGVGIKQIGENGEKQIAMSFDTPIKLIDNEIFPVIEKKCTSVNGEFTILYTSFGGLRIAYQGAGVEYQNKDGDWIDTNGVNPEEYVDRPQRINHALRSKTYKNEGGIIINLLDESGKCIRQKESDNILIFCASGNVNEEINYHLGDSVLGGGNPERYNKPYKIYDSGSAVSTSSFAASYSSASRLNKELRLQEQENLEKDIKSGSNHGKLRKFFNGRKGKSKGK